MWLVAFNLGGWRNQPFFMFLSKTVKFSFKVFDTQTNDRYYRSPMQQKTIIYSNPVYDGGMKTGRPTRSEKTDFAKRLCHLRKATGLSQREIARRMNLAQSSYANWERFNVALKPEQLRKLAEVLGVNVAELLTASSAKRRGGPAGKMRQLFEAASRLPRSQQQKVVDVLQPFVAQHSHAN